MNERREDAPLSTADMVSASRQQQPAAPTQPAGAKDDREFVQQGARTDGQTPVRTNGSTATATAPAKTERTASATAKTAPLLPGDQTDNYRSRWEEIQTGFVDEPRHAVERADQLVAEVIKRIAEVFADERGKLEGQWSRGGEVDTEALRVALTRYRSFFERLLSA